MEDQLDKIFYQIRMLYLNAIFTWIVLVIIFVLVLTLPRRMLDYFLKNMKMEITFGGLFSDVQKVTLIPNKAFKAKGTGGNGEKDKKSADGPGRSVENTGK